MMKMLDKVADILSLLNFEMTKIVLLLTYAEERQKVQNKKSPITSCDKSNISKHIREKYFQSPTLDSHCHFN